MSEVNKKLLKSFSKLYKIKELGERANELANGIKREFKLKAEVEIPYTLTFYWNEGDQCDVEIEIEDGLLSQQQVISHKKAEAAAAQIKKDIDNEIKEICDMSDSIGINPDDFLDYYEERMNNES